MPELPEVETVRRQLEQELLGEVFASVEVRDRKVFSGEENKLIGQKIIKFGRLGKYILVYFESGQGMVVHLKMTGRLVVRDTFYETAPHTRIKAKFESGKEVYYWDTRKFGYWQVHESIEVLEKLLTAKLGPEPWLIDPKEWYKKLAKRNKPIKELILDQSHMAGVGNIYANDALWLAKIDPRRRASSLSLAEAKRLLEAIRAVLERGLESGGASDNTYRDLYGERGSYQDKFLVYGKTKGECMRCHNPLKYIKLGGRGTWVCEKCQK